MGYYTGSGQTSGGASTVTSFGTGYDTNGAFYIFQRTNSSVTQKNGVSLATAQGESGDMSLNYQKWPGGMITAACKGSRRQVSFAQINGSNLYTLQITNESIAVRAKQGTYDSGWQT